VYVKAVRVCLSRIAGKKQKNPKDFLFAVTGGGGRGEGEGGITVWELTPDTVRWYIHCIRINTKDCCIALPCYYVYNAIQYTCVQYIFTLFKMDRYEQRTLYIYCYI
jgi:hypothetical protein